LRALVQRVTEARVSVDDAVVGEIGAGLCVLVGVTHSDNDDVARRLADKVVQLRIFADEAGTMNRSLLDVGGAALVVSQFTLYGDARRGRRPSWAAAAPSAVAEPVVRVFAGRLAESGVKVETGCFGAEMRVGLVNDGPVTLMLELGRGAEAL
jgi:D-tyrosyl-tRNA(Tyr) deacylase